MKIKQLEYLVKVMECGSITQAAQQMHVSQPSLTKSISNLEEEFGIQILVRRARGVEFTQKGLDFVRYAKGVLAAVAAYPKASSVPTLKARLFIATQQLDFFYPLVLQEYKRHGDGNVFFNLVETDRSDVVKKVLKGQVDMGLAVRTSMDTKDMIWNRQAHRLDIKIVDSNHPYIAVGPKSPLWNKTSVTMGDARGFLHVAVDMEEQAKEGFWLECGQYQNLNNNRIIFVNSMRACERFLLETDAMSFCAYWAIGCFDDPQIHVIPVIGSDMDSQELMLIRRKGEPMTEEEQYFTKALCERLGVSALRSDAKNAYEGEAEDFE